MVIFGIDFTSSPSRRKPITCARCDFNGRELSYCGIQAWQSFDAFENAIPQPGPWIAGVDFPFGQSRKFVETIGWPLDWRDYVLHASSLGRAGFRAALNGYRLSRPFGDKEHRRATDVAASSISPQKLFGVPVGLMFFEGASRLAHSGVKIPHLQAGDPNRVVVEAYPGVVARRLIGRRSYKQDAKRKQTREQLSARQEILIELKNGVLEEAFGFSVRAPDTLALDPSGDQLDALLCAIQAAWAWNNRATGFGAPSLPDPLEGWIADPLLKNSSTAF